jgi:hypothetical protein
MEKRSNKGSVLTAAGGQLSSSNNNSSMRYSILENPPWLQAIGLGFQVNYTHVWS